jgi:hypothetical protein
MASPRRGDAVSVPCRVCGRTFLKVTVVDGAHPLKCASCGRTTTVRIKCRGEACQVMTEAAPKGDPGRTPG